MLHLLIPCTIYRCFSLAAGEAASGFVASRLAPLLVQMSSKQGYIYVQEVFNHASETLEAYYQKSGPIRAWKEV